MRRYATILFGLVIAFLLNVQTNFAQPAITGLGLSPQPTAFTTENLICSFSLSGSATTAVTSWYKNGNPHMKFYLPMEGGTTNAKKDFSGNGSADVILGESPTWSSNAGFDGKGAYVFDGNDYLNAGNIFPTLSSYTVTAWVKRTTNDDWQNIVSNADGSFSHLLLVHSGNLECGHNELFSLGGGSIALNTWYFVAVTFNYVSGKLILYKNGTEANSKIVGTKNMTNAGTWIGRYGGGANWRGTIDDVRIYAIELTAQQIAAMYNAGAGNNQLMVSQETNVNDQWHVRVTPFSASEVGTTALSDITTIIASPPPSITNLQLNPFPLIGITEYLICSYNLVTPATTSSTAWYKNGSPTMTLYLPMEGGSTNALLDYSGNGFNASAIASPTWNSTGGYDGKGAFTFNGSTQYLDAGQHFPTSSSYTKTAWVKRTGATGNNIISGGANNGGHAFWANNNGGKRLEAGHNGTWNIVQDVVDLTLNQWYFVALTFDYATGQMILYRDGLPRNTGTAAIGNRNVTVSNIYIGSFGTEGFRWTGSIDDARVYPYVLSPEQIAAMYNSGTGNNNIMEQEEIEVGEIWNCRVTPFSAMEAGQTVISNAVEVPLPVELSSFEFLVQKDKIQLSWSTISETRNYGFEIERAGTKNDWHKIGFINGTGNSNTPKSYQFIDDKPLGGNKFFYRLKQIDVDGRFEYSAILEVDFYPTEFSIYQNYPNPFNPSTKIRFQLPKESKVVIKIYDILGALVRELLNETKLPGIYEVAFDANGLTDGTYIYRIEAGDFIKSNKMTLIK